MPTDFQIIDGFERLREAFLRENPARRPEAQPAAALTSEERVAQSWLQTNDARLDDSPPQRRRLRALMRGLLGSSEALPDNRNGFPDGDRRLIDRAGDFRAALEQARARGLAPLVAEHSPRSPAEEAREWSAALPGLSGLKAWRFLELLDRPVIQPQASVRRMLWRLGLVESNPGAKDGLESSHAALQRIAELTGIPYVLLGTLVRWHSTARAGYYGGAWCVAAPRCTDCPLRAACAWVRFHPDESDASPRPVGDRNAAARRQVVEGHQHQLEEVELLALALPARSGGQTGRELAEDLLRRFSGVRGIERAAVAELAAVRGLSQKQAVSLKSALELGRRLAERALQPGDPIRGSEDVWRAYRSRYRNLPQEHFVIVLLDAKNRAIQDQIVSKGTLTQSLAHPREVFHHAVRQSAAGVILIHNHPSGDPTPSPEDFEVTRRLRQAGEILGIQVLDHIILGADRYYSFKDEE